MFVANTHADSVCNSCSLQHWLHNWLHKRMIARLQGRIGVRTRSRMRDVLATLQMREMMDTLCVQETLAKSPNADVSDSISSSIRSRSQILLHKNHSLRPCLILPMPESSEKIAGCLPAQSIRSRSQIWGTRIAASGHASFSPCQNQARRLLNAYADQDGMPGHQILLHKGRSLRPHLSLPLPESHEKTAGCTGRLKVKARAYGRNALHELQHTNVALGSEGLVSCTWGPG